MPPHPAPFRLAAPAAAVVLAMLAGDAAAAPPRPSPALASPAVADAAQAAAALTAAQDRAARAAAAIDDLKRELGPGHLTDPMPETDRAFGLASLRADYADAQRRAAGYRATLGNQHPTLLTTVQLMDDLRAQLLDGTRKALASAERDAADARADIAAAERRPTASSGPAAMAAAGRGGPVEPRAVDVTGTIDPPPRPAARTVSPLSLPPAAPTQERRAAVDTAPPPAQGSRPSRALAAAVAAAAVALAALLAAWAALRLLRPRRQRSPPVAARRVEPAMAAPATARSEAVQPRQAVADGVPVLGRLELPGSADALTAAFADAPGEGVSCAAAGLHATLRDAFGDATGRMTVLVSAAADLPVASADAAALALARAAATAGRRPLLMEARVAGRLRGALVPADVSPLLIEAGGAVRTLYRLGGGPAVALLPSDEGEAEAAVAAAARAGTGRLRGFDAFDTIILVGDDAAALASGADLLLLAALADAAPAALAEAASPLRDTGRPCGAVMVAVPASSALPEASAAEAAAVARPAPRPMSIPRRRPLESASPVRLGLRGSIDPARRRVGG